MTLTDAILRVERTRDARLAGRIADQLRRKGFTYLQVVAFVESLAPELTADVWEGLMQEADQLEGERREDCED